MLDVLSDKPWHLIELPNCLGSTRNLVFSPISETQLIIIGGQDVTLFEVKKKTAKIVNAYPDSELSLPLQQTALYAIDGLIVFLATKTQRES